MLKKAKIIKSEKLEAEPASGTPTREPVLPTNKSGLVKSPLNYMGGKYKLLPHLLPLFPQRPIDVFVDLFAGGMNVGVNVKSGKLISNDLLTQLVEINEMFYTSNTDKLIAKVESKIREYDLSKTNKLGYLSLREQYNTSPNPLDLFVLACHSFNHQIRFNKKGELNIPFGANRSSWNETMKRNLISFTARAKQKPIVFTNEHFSDVDMSLLTHESFVYADPPYLISDGAYNDGSGGVGGGWGEKEEIQLLEMLDTLHAGGVQFGLSNVTIHKGKKNTLLTTWSKKYNVHYLDKNYSNSNYHIKDRTALTVEVYVTNVH